MRIGLSRVGLKGRCSRDMLHGDDGELGVHTGFSKLKLKFTQPLTGGKHLFSKKLLYKNKDWYEKK